MKKIVSILLFCLCVVNNFMAQISKAEYWFDHSIAHYNHKNNYKLELIYKMFKGVKKDTITEQYSFEIIKNDKKVKLKFEDYDMYVMNDLKFTIDKSSSIVYLNPLGANQNPGLLLSNLEQLKLYYSISIHKEINSKVILSLTPKETALASSLPYKQIEMTLLKKDFSIIHQDLLFSQKLPFVTKENQTELDEACLSVDLKEQHFNIESDKIPHQSYFFRQTTSSIVLASPFKKYKLIDQRSTNTEQ